MYFVVIWTAACLLDYNLLKSKDLSSTLYSQAQALNKYLSVCVEWFPSYRITFSNKRNII